MLFLYRPENPLTETLRFLTQVLPHKDGSEQRQCLRSGPRTEYAADVVVEDGLDRDIVENALYGNQGGTWTIPAWPETCFLTTAVNSGVTSIATDHSFSDYRAGEKAIIYQDENTYDVLDAITLTSGHIGFTTPTTHNWPVGSEIYPLRDCLISGSVNTQRYPTNVASYRFLFGVLDTGINLFTGSLPSGSSLSFATMGFGPDTAALVLSDPNAMDATLAESSESGFKFIDANTGKFSSFGYWLASRRNSRKGFVCHTRQDLWAIRVLLHALRGQQQAFFLPTFAKDFVPLGGIASGGTTLAVANANWTGYVQGKFRKYIRVELADGTHIDNSITSSVVNTSVQETITVATNWPAAVSLGNIARITVYEKVRLASDDIDFTHQSLVGEMTTSFPVKAVLE